MYIPSFRSLEIALSTERSLHVKLDGREVTHDFLKNSLRHMRQVDYSYEQFKAKAGKSRWESHRNRKVLQGDVATVIRFHSSSRPSDGHPAPLYKYYELHGELLLQRPTDEMLQPSIVFAPHPLRIMKLCHFDRLVCNQIVHARLLNKLYPRRYSQ